MPSAGSVQISAESEWGSAEKHFNHQSYEIY